jgi:hypothetical protein
MSVTNSNDAFGNQTRDHPACSTASQPIAPPHARELKEIQKKYFGKCRDFSVMVLEC